MDKIEVVLTLIIIFAGAGKHRSKYQVRGRESLGRQDKGFESSVDPETCSPIERAATASCRTS